MPTPFDGLGLCCHALKSCAPCDCSDNEIAMRHYASPRHALSTMNAEQRAWCLDQISSHARSASTPDPACSDAELARAVLKAWSQAVRF